MMVGVPCWHRSEVRTVRAATADKSMLKIAVLLLSVRSSHSCVCGSENPICESGGWCTAEEGGSSPWGGVCGGHFGDSCSRSYALCPDIASVTVAGVTYTEEPYGTYTPLTQNGCHSGPKKMPTFRNNEAASECALQQTSPPTLGHLCGGTAATATATTRTTDRQTTPCTCAPQTSTSASQKATTITVTG